MEYLKFQNGLEMPIIGLGTSQVPDPDEMEATIEHALRIGYRHFDTAYMYKNEEILGRVFKRWMDAGTLKREELFIVSKLPWTGMSPNRVEHFVQLSLEALSVSYIDLYLIHWPIAMQYIDDTTMLPTDEHGDIMLDHESDLVDVWKAMEHLVDKCLVKSIGVGNFNAEQLETIVKIARILPSNLQVEMHLYFQQLPLRKICERYGITVTAYSPLGSPGRSKNNKYFKDRFISPKILSNETVQEISESVGQSTATVLLRFLTQLGEGVAVIPKSVTPSKLKENFEILSLNLTSFDMETLKKLDKGEAGRAFTAFPGSELHKDCPFRTGKFVEEKNNYHTNV